MNFWFWLFIFLIPFIVFSVKPEASPRLRVARLLLAVAIGYVLANVTLYWEGEQEWETYTACQRQFDDGDTKHHQECPEINIADGARTIFFVVFGWIPAAAYAGFWELIWRRRHRHTLRAMGTAFKGKWASNALIIFSIPVWLYIGVLSTGIIIMVACQWNGPDKCV